MTKLEIAAVKIRQALNEAFPSNKAKRFTSAILTAAGSGVRFGNESKVFYPLDGAPCLSYVLKAFQDCSGIDEIVVTAKPNDFGRIEKLAAANGVTKLTKVVAGGATRQESVRIGFAAVDPKADLVAIQDGDRPLIRPKDIEKVLSDARRYGAATAASRITDTVKRGDERGMIAETVPRDHLYLVQTPQIFLTDLYRVSLALAQKNDWEVTDDNSLAEKAGFKVKLTLLSEENDKLTRPEDVVRIERILKERHHAGD